MIKANFFWHGPALSLYEAACLGSFVRDGIEVRLHTFNLDLPVPTGVKLFDAGLLADLEEVFAFSQGGQKGSVAAFTDIFRYRLLQREPGWWFDTDVYCLKGAADFVALEQTSKGILVGEEAPGKLNGAVLYVSEPRLAAELEARANAKGVEFEWGDIGPQLITQFLLDRPECVSVVGASRFYPVHYLETAMFFQPEEADACRERAREAVCVHLWNEFLRRWQIPKNVLPCEGSYLHQLFDAQQMVVSPNATLPSGVFEALRQHGEIGRMGSRALKFIKSAKQIKERVVGR